jgi:hypothetical protein
MRLIEDERLSPKPKAVIINNKKSKRTKRNMGVKNCIPCIKHKAEKNHENVRMEKIERWLTDSFFLTNE